MLAVMMGVADGAEVRVQLTVGLDLVVYFAPLEYGRAVGRPGYALRSDVSGAVAWLPGDGVLGLAGGPSFQMETGTLRSPSAATFAVRAGAGRYSTTSPSGGFYTLGDVQGLVAARLAYRRSQLRMGVSSGSLVVARLDATTAIVGDGTPAVAVGLGVPFVPAAEVAH